MQGRQIFSRLIDDSHPLEPAEYVSKEEAFEFQV
jgi:hypothetical protein